MVPHVISVWDSKQSIIHVMMPCDDSSLRHNSPFFKLVNDLGPWSIIDRTLWLCSIGKVPDALFSAMGSAHCHLKQLEM